MKLQGYYLSKDCSDGQNLDVKPHACPPEKISPNMEWKKPRKHALFEDVLISGKKIASKSLSLPPLSHRLHFFFFV